MKTNKENLKYIDKEILWSNYPEIIIKVASVNEKYGTIVEFVNDCRLKGITNGKLFIMENLKKNDKETQEFVDNLTNLFSFIVKEDYFITAYYNKTQAEKLEFKRKIKLHNYNKTWLCLKDYLEGAEMWYIPTENEDVKNIHMPNIQY